MLSYVIPPPSSRHLLAPSKTPFRAPFTLPVNAVNQEFMSEDNICRIQDLGNDEEFESERRISCSVVPVRKSAFSRVSPGPVSNLLVPSWHDCSHYWSPPEKVPTRQYHHSEKGLITTHIIDFRKRRVGTHPAEKEFIERFQLDNADYQIDNGKLLKTDQLAKNVLRWMTRYDKRRIQQYSLSEKGKQTDIQTQYQYIFDYFSSQYHISDFSNFDRNMICTLFAPLKVREEKLRRESGDETSPTPGKKKAVIVKDRLQLFSGDVDRTSQFFKYDPGRTIYFSSFKNVFLIYQRTLMEMNQKKRSQGFAKFLNQISERMKV